MHNKVYNFNGMVDNFLLSTVLLSIPGNLIMRTDFKNSLFAFHTQIHKERVQSSYSFLNDK